MTRSGTIGKYGIRSAIINYFPAVPHFGESLISYDCMFELLRR